MLYWSITLIFTFVGAFLGWITLTHCWNKLDKVIVNVLPTLRMGTYMPGEYRYLDLKFSLVRHAFVFLVTASLIYAVKSRIALYVFVLGNGFYSISTLTRYWKRRDILEQLKNESEESRSLANLLGDPFRASRVVVVYSILSGLLALFLYGVRP